MLLIMIELWPQFTDFYTTFNLMESFIGKWQIWIDTGGTFTDCIAISPNQERLRFKVLSSGCLRGRVLEKISPGRYRFEANWNIKRDVFQGYLFKVIRKENL